MKIKVVKTTNFRPSEKIFLNTALNILEKVINSEIFKNEIIKYKFNERNEFNWNYIVRDGKRTYLTNEQIYNFFMSGSESFDRITDFEMDLNLTIKNGCDDDTIGSTQNRMEIKTYRCQLEKGEVFYAKHLAHEYCHVLGFKHQEKYNSNRPFTVPYGIGSIVSNLGGLFLLSSSPISINNFVNNQLEGEKSFI